MTGVIVNQILEGNGLVRTHLFPANLVEIAPLLLLFLCRLGLTADFHKLDLRLVSFAVYFHLAVSVKAA